MGSLVVSLWQLLSICSCRELTGGEVDRIEYIIHAILRDSGLQTPINARWRRDTSLPRVHRSALPVPFAILS